MRFGRLSEFKDVAKVAWLGGVTVVLTFLVRVQVSTYNLRQPEWWSPAIADGVQGGLLLLIFGYGGIVLISFIEALRSVFSETRHKEDNEEGGWFA